MKYLLSTLTFLLLLVACKTSQDIIESNEDEKPEIITEAEIATNVEAAEEAMLLPASDVSPEAETKRLDMSPKSTFAVSPPPSRTSGIIAEPIVIAAAASSKRMSYDGYSAGASPRVVSTYDPAITAGQLTAGEWNDLIHWEDWKELLVNGDYIEMQEYWKLYPSHRYTVFVRNKYELPIQDALVQLLDKKGTVIWTARTDNAGHAELWGDITVKEKSTASYDIKVTTEAASQTIQDVKLVENIMNSIVLPISCLEVDAIDIMFVVDATGSMGDEIRYLQAELQDVITRATEQVKSKNVRLGSVFYRDHGDAYVTRVQDLDKDYSKALGFIADQSADGGGDYPEAVEEALDAALSQEWSSKAQARLLFLLLDAPPHEDEATMIRIRRQVQEAAELGIKIIPITASGINRQTEFLMKFMAISTNGTYVFLTDHSGIGGGHLEHIEPDYEVEKFNDLLVRLIYHYSKSNGCEADQQQTVAIENFKVYPNPASKMVNISSSSKIKVLRVVSNSGKMVHQEENLDAGEHEITLGDLVDGIYTLSIITEEGEVSRPLIVVHNT